MYSGQSQGSTQFPSFFSLSYIIITVPWENQASAYHISFLQFAEEAHQEESEKEESQDRTLLLQKHIYQIHVT